MKVLKWIGIIIGIIFLVGVLAGIVVPQYEAYQKRAQQATGEQRQVQVPSPSPETEKEYIASTKQVTRKQIQNSIYYKEFLKNPDKFKGVRLNVLGKIMAIEENDGMTTLQIYISNDFDVVIVYYLGSMAIYRDDFVRVYGEGGGSLVGQNRMGATMSWPVIIAKYIKKQVVEE